MDRELPREFTQDYKKVVEEIKNLEWEKLSAEELQDLMYISYIAAVEFAESLRVALELYPDDEKIKKMAQEELSTGNLKYKDYETVGDHSAFLEHFIDNYKIKPSEEVEQQAVKYLESCRKMSGRTRAMSIFSREQELSRIFEEILKAKDWEADGLEEYRYYLKTHIDLDSSQGGHGEQTQHMPIDDSVREFYEARLELYTAIPKLFEHDKN
jgi:hypothetical protein